MTTPPGKEPHLPSDHSVHAIARACRDAGGRVLIVGGWVRDALAAPRAADAREEEPEFDLEVHGLSPDALSRALSRFGAVRVVGKSFPIFLVGRLPIELSLPRRAGPRAGPEDRWEAFDPMLSFAEAALGRDLRVNAMAWDPLSEELLDPHDGRADLRAGRLRATCPSRFGEDPARGLRTAQLAARLELAPDAELLALCRATDLDGVPGERLLAEFRKLLLWAREPSRGFALLRETGLLRFFPVLAALEGVPQDPQWHPEGDVFTHTLRVIDAAAAERVGEALVDLVLMFGALCHDLGKPGTTREESERIAAPGHSAAGIVPTGEFLFQLRAPHKLVVAVQALVRHHLAPRTFVEAVPPAGPRAYRRLARELRAAGVTFDVLVRLARADHRGRSAAGAETEGFPGEARFIEGAAAVEHEEGTHTDAVTGRALLERGLEEGPAMGALLARCREIQEETGLRDPAEILDRALAESAVTRETEREGSGE